MMIWIRAQDVRIWKVIEQGNRIPMKKSTTKVGEVSTEIEIPKLESEFNDDDWKKEEERIEETLERFSRIFNGLNMLGKKYPEREIIIKILRSLTPKWNSKANAIVEGIHYQNETLTYDQLRGNLLTYEMTILDP
ncbi:hypothetical protein PIB30_059904 [Stylosanthes scabra]|uniref:UBN2 domain-containing protein n=1 Tax=Stylosanthes scabra TaxID=79078 RepID=A0ABU6RKL5_9FABA|nr:hypothetical protein [Stylosanthes scabra]